MILIFISFENRKDAQKVANYLIDERLVACVSIFPTTSYYWWKGKKMEAQEIEAIIKTKEENFDKIEEAVGKLLPYEVPQLIAIDAKKVNKKYLDWLEKETK